MVTILNHIVAIINGQAIMAGLIKDMHKFMFAYVVQAVNPCLRREVRLAASIGLGFDLSS